jgi:probable HAF family extracellular repeat protein
MAPTATRISSAARKAGPQTAGLRSAHPARSWQPALRPSALGTSGGQAHATLWREGAIIDLGALPGAALSVATGMNDRGQIVGWGYNAAFQPRALLWNDGQIIDLGTLPGGTESFAMDINDRGSIAGFSNSEAVPTSAHAALWSETKGSR